MASELKEQQDEELEAIQAIFMDDYHDHTKPNGSHEFSIHLVPHQSTVAKDVHAKLDLLVKFTTKYPNDPPLLCFENSKGLSDEDLKNLKTEITKMADQLCGEVMILQLTHHIQEFLHGHNKPSLSFFEQMLANQMKQEELQNIEQQKLEAAKVAQDREKDEDVIRQVKEELKKRTAEKRKRQISQSQSYPASSKSDVSGQTSNIARKTPFKCTRSSEHHKFFVYNFKESNKKVFCSSCFGHYYDGACTRLGIDEATGNQLSFTEWKWKTTNQKKKVHFNASETNSDENTTDKQVQNIIQEFNFLKNKITFNGLLNYHAIDIDENSHYITIKLLMDSISGPSLSTYLQKDGLPLSTLQHICQQIVDCLNFLHNKSIAHQNLNLNTTFVNACNDIILSGYAVVKRISDLYLSFNGPDKDSDDNTKYFKQETKSGKKGDIFSLGLIMFSLYLGRENLDLQIPADVPEPLQSFLKSCLCENEDRRATISQLTQHPFICEKIVINPANDQVKDQKSKGDLSSDGNEADKQLVIPLFYDNFTPGKSRLLNEFDTLEWLGKGGFGSVIKVKNKLDGNMYALKRIRLNPSNLQIHIKRITREVKLLSRLNHENVVRYFNSWIEAEDIKFAGDTSVNETDSDLEQIEHAKKETKQVQPMENKPKNLEELLMLNDIKDNEVFPQTSTNLDSSWCEMSSNGKRVESTSSNSSDESTQGNGFFKTPSFKSKRSSCRDSSEGIFFNDDSMLQFGDYLDSEESENEDTQPTTAGDTFGTKTTTATTTETTESSLDDNQAVQYLYIQMEYCEKSTLRDIINDGIYKEPEKVGRYFREIVEGLAHVHSQGIIHRDLKPFNIFLDSKDRIKIGDFGLATSHNSAKDNPASFLQLNDPSAASSDKMTGKVGTALYVAPELGVARGRIRFSQKVDMYSLGIILFEMCYRPLTTGMERVQTIGLLRSENKVLPEDFYVKKFAREKYVILWLVNHSPDDRPTAQELLESSYVPPKLEDRHLDELLKHTLNQTNSTRYQRLMTTLFNQPVPPVNDQIFDSDLHGKTEDAIVTAAKILQHVRDVIVRLFEKHGGIFIETPLLIPKSKLLDNFKHVATMIDQSGTQLCLPYDSRLSFARYVSRNNINSIRRYYFGKLYRDQKMNCTHPVELWECSFDIVTDCAAYSLPVAETVYVVLEVIREFSSLSQRHFYVQINHSDILRAIFLQNNFSEDLKERVLGILSSTKNKKVLETQLTECFNEMEIQEHIINRALTLLTFEGTTSKAKDVLQGLRKTKPNISNLVKQAFSEIESVIRHLNDLEANIHVNLCTHLTSHIFNSGIVFQVVAENTRKKKHGGLDIFALGGCYNQLVMSMSRYAETSNLPTAVGVSIAVEKLLIAVDELRKQEGCQKIVKDHVIVCSVVTNKPHVEMLLHVVHELWEAGISASLFSYETSQDYTLEEIQEFCKENNVNCFVVLKDTDLECVRVKIRDKEKFNETRIARRELCDFIRQKHLNKTETSTTKEIDTLTKHLSISDRYSDIKGPSFFFTYVAPFESNKKRIYEGKFKSKYQLELTQTLGNVDIQVVAANLSERQLKTVSAYLELKGSYEEFDKSLQEVLDIWTKDGQFMKRLCHTLQQVYSESDSVLLLYSFLTEKFMVFL